MAGGAGGYTHITTATTTVVRTGMGVLMRVMIGTVATGTATLFDNTAGSGNVIGVLTYTAPGAPQVLEIDVAFNVGLTIVTTGTADLTIVIC